MNILTKMVATLFAMAATLPSAALAQSPIALSGDVKEVETVVDASGNETTRLVEPTSIVPGDRLIFGTDYANNGDEAVENFVVTNALPSAVRLASDANPDLTVSVDNGDSWGVLASLTIVEVGGTTRAAVHADVTHVRWTLATIAPGETGRVEYPAIIR